MVRQVTRIASGRGWTEMDGDGRSNTDVYLVQALSTVPMSGFTQAKAAKAAKAVPS